MKYCDLHVHTTVSDGSLTPAEVVARAKSLGVSAIAVTDHDTCEGVPEAQAAGNALGLEIIPGIEISVDYLGAYGIHILGHFIDPGSAAMQRLLDWVIAERKRRNRLIADAMHADGIPVYVEQLRERYPESVVGRPHFAIALVELGYAESISDAFNRYLNMGQKYYFQRRYIPMKEGLQIILDAGGKPTFAHPYQYRMDESTLLSLARELRDGGAVGIECVYSGYTVEQQDYLKQIADHFGFCLTGGSDFHGERKPQIEIGGPRVPYELLEKLRQA